MDSKSWLRTKPGASSAHINLFALALRSEIAADQLGTAMFAYPTAASDISYML